jgi:methyltransferase (TIGR00027 family)
MVVERAGRGVGQYVILGAGLDSFAQRRPEIASSLTVFEVDPPSPQAWKRRRLIELGFGIPEWLRLVPVDFEAGDAWWQRLAAAGFDSGQPAIVASTGVSMYLTKDAIAATLRQIAALAPGSMLAMTFLLPLELADPEVRPGLQLAEKGARASGTPFISFFTPTEIWHWPAKPDLEKSSTYPPPLLPNATSRAGQMAFARQIIQRNCWWR